MSSIVECLESLRYEIHSTDISIKENALKKIVNNVSNLSYYSINAATVECLLSFYVNLLNEHYAVLETILDGISNLINFDSFSNAHAKVLALAIIQLDVAQLKVPVRLLAYSILENLFVHHNSVMATLDTSFIREYMNIVSGESDPQCVLHVLHINAQVAKTLHIDNVYDELFETISVYFPIEFKANKNSGSLTREQIVAANKLSMLASPLFGSQLFPTLMDKLSSDMKSSRMDSLDILSDAFVQMNFEDVLMYYLSFQSILYQQYKNRDPEIQELVRKCLVTLSSQFQAKATDKDLLEYSWHIYELCHSAIANDDDALNFILISITNKSRLWSSFVAHFLPTIAEKALNENLEDLDRLKNLIAILSAYDNLSQFPGLVDNVTVRHLFTKANLLYFQIDEFSIDVNDNLKMTVLFRLLSLYSLFNVVVPESGSSGNMTHDNNTVIASQVALVSKAMNKAAIIDHCDLDGALIELVPRMVVLSISDGRSSSNGLIDLIIDLTQLECVQAEISFRIMRQFPVSLLSVVLDQCMKSITGSVVREEATSCLAVLSERLCQDISCCDQVYVTITTIIESLITTMDCLAAKNVENLALAIAHLGPLTDDSCKSDILRLLINGMRNEGPNNATVILLCSAVGRWRVETIEMCLKVTELLYMLVGVLLMSVDAQICGIVSVTCGSLVNKCSSSDHDVETFLTDYLVPMADNGLFLLCLLKACVHSGHKSMVTRLIEMITDSRSLSRPLGKSLASNIEILSTSAALVNNRHFCTDRQLFPTQALFFEQQIYYLLTQRFQQLATEVGQDKRVTDIAMELYLKLVSGFSDNVLEMCVDEVVETVMESMSQLCLSRDRVDLQVQVLRSLSHLKLDDSVLVRVKAHSGDIVRMIVSVADNCTSLSVDERLCVVKSVVWLLEQVLEPTESCDLSAIRQMLNVMSRDQKRVVRMAVIRARLALNVYDVAV